MPSVEDIFKVMQHPPTKEEKDLITRAYHFAEKAHEGQKRASGEPYFIHVYETSKNVAQFGMEATTIAAALLHDSIEDTPVTEAALQKEFGPEITFLVKGVTKLGTLKYRGRERHVESLRKFFMAMAEDLRVVVIKLGDRLHNVHTLQYLPPEKAKRIALETIEIHAPLAYRLGMGRLTGELEDAAFPYAYPKENAMVEELLKQRKKPDERYIDGVYKKIKKEMALQNIKDVETHYRIKRKYSLYQKLLQKDMEIDKVYDIIALRVIVPTVEDCYRVLGMIHTMWRPLPGRIKDYIALPKVNGYQSLHTTIFTGDGGIAEIQIRTPEMHRFAEYGFASHALYKEEKKKKDALSLHKDTFPWLTQLKDLQKEEKEPEQFLENLKTDFLDHRIFVFTPDGDVVDLPQDSSVLDFAYSIHSHIGNHASGAKVNNKFVALKTKLRNGDIVKIETKKDSHPTSSWLDFAKTTIAKKHIRNYLKEHSLMNKFFGK